MEIRLDKRLENNIEIDLKNILENEIYYTDANLIDFISTKFAERGLARSIPNKLFMNLTTVKELRLVELILFVKYLNEYGKDNNIEELEKLEPQNYFGDMDIIDAEKYTEVSEMEQTFVLENAIEIGKLTWIGFKKAIDIGKDKKSELFGYDFNYQREGKLREIGTTGTVVKDITLNKDTVKRIGEMLYENKYGKPDMIAFNIPVLTDKNNTPRVTFDKGILTVTPDYNTKDNHITTINSLDGWHRINASEYMLDKAIKEGDNLNSFTDGFIVMITMMEDKQAREYFKRINTFNPISKDYLNTFETSDIGKFVKAMVDWNDDRNILNNRVSNTFEEAKAFSNKLTYYKVLEESIKLTGIDVKNIMSEITVMPKYIRFMTRLIEYIQARYYDNVENSFEYMQNETVFLSINIWVGYIAIANKIEEKDINKMLPVVAEKLMDSNVQFRLNKIMNLNKKLFNYKELYNYFEQLI